MSSINGSQALSILGGSEGAIDNSVDLPVSKELLGKSRVPLFENEQIGTLFLREGFHRQSE